MRHVALDADRAGHGHHVDEREQFHGVDPGGDDGRLALHRFHAGDDGQVPFAVLGPVGVPQRRVALVHGNATTAEALHRLVDVLG